MCSWFILRRFQCYDYIEWNDRIISEWWIAKYVEESSRGQFGVLRKNTKNLSQNSRWLDRDLSRDLQKTKLNNYWFKSCCWRAGCSQWTGLSRLTTEVIREVFQHCTFSTFLKTRRKFRPANFSSWLMVQPLVLASSARRYGYRDTSSSPRGVLTTLEVSYHITFEVTDKVMVYYRISPNIRRGFLQILLLRKGGGGVALFSRP
jgi:hypothetical protein